MLGLSQIKLLIVGVGGIGCELLRLASMEKFVEIDIIDMDRVEFTNLRRQQLFCKSDIGKPKVNVAKKYIEKLNKDVKIRAHFNAIEQMRTSFYNKFDVIMCGLDTYEARRWLNSVILQLPFKFFQDRPYRRPILIEGATEGLMGSVRLIIPSLTACYECTLDLVTENVDYPVCTIISTPRLPEHCIQNVLFVQWPKYYEDIDFDCKKKEHVAWVIDKSMQLAEDRGISGLTPELAIKIILRIIPSSMSTNCIIACLMLSRLKVLMSGEELLPRYQLTIYSAINSVFMYNHRLSILNSCPLCSTDIPSIMIPPDTSVKNCINLISKQKRLIPESVSIRSATRTIYMSSPVSLKRATEKNLPICISSFISNNESVFVSTKHLPHTFKISITFQPS